MMSEPTWKREEFKPWQTIGVNESHGETFELENIPLRRVFLSRGWQWAVICLINALAILNYFEITPSIYSLYPKFTHIL
jgi:hypothetical protein